MHDSSLIDWAKDWKDYNMGSHVDKPFQTPEKALGKAKGTTDHIVSLGRGGSITLIFDPPIRNGEGWDFAIFENAFDDRFLELACVEVSSNGTDFVRFNNCSLTPDPVNAFGSVDYTNITGLAGKYQKGLGTPFDLFDLKEKEEVNSGLVNLNRISYVKILDIVGDGSYIDNRSMAWKTRWGDHSAIYDPYPTVGSAGFDLDAVGIRYQNTAPEGSDDPPQPPELLFPEDEVQDISLTPTLMVKTSDKDMNNLACTQWQLSIDTNFLLPLLDITSQIHLNSLTLHSPILDYENIYYWRVKFYDVKNAESTWSDVYAFKTTKITIDNNSNGIPDTQELNETSTEDFNEDDISDFEQISSQFKCLNIFSGTGTIGIKTNSNHVEIDFIESIDPNTIDPKHILHQPSRPDMMPLGLLNFRLNVEESGDHANLTIYASEPIRNEIKWFIYDFIDGWRDASNIIDPNHTPSHHEKSISFQMQDGGPEDADGVANGLIIGQGGPGYYSPVIPPPNEQAGMGGLGSCFVGVCYQNVKNKAIFINADRCPWQ
jgi:hypothetical protein